ncbi:MAG: DUF3221 domain-containing protein [Candidatus Atribacteria bacterium]|nr:DUF3221 domain-containing protein [Candidatus Atribacteria bacterium]MCD6350077.1 DUF3221 domain-containing protein [Candidatus Atribacteria bacterium]
MIKNHIFALAILKAFMLLIVAGCMNSPLLSPPDLEGSIREYQEGADVHHCSILVEENTSGSSQYDLAWVRITEDTAITRNGVEVEGVACLSLEEGMQVRVWFAGPVMESYPVQGYARRIEIMD